MSPVDINHKIPSLEEVKRHWRSHKREYLIGGSCLVVGFLLRKPMNVTVIINHHFPA